MGQYQIISSTDRNHDIAQSNAAAQPTNRRIKHHKTAAKLSTAFCQWGHPIAVPIAVRGFSNPDIDKQLGISLDMVKEHIETLFQKIGAASRAEAVAIALRKHLLKI